MLRPSYPGVSPGASLSLLPRMGTLRCLLSFPFRDLKPENILLDDYGELGPRGRLRGPRGGLQGARPQGRWGEGMGKTSLQPLSPGPGGGRDVDKAPPR